MFPTLPLSDWGLSFPGLFVESTRKGNVVSRANSIGSTSASSVPNTGRQLHPPHLEGLRHVIIVVPFLDREAPAIHTGVLEPKYQTQGLTIFHLIWNIRFSVHLPSLDTRFFPDGERWASWTPLGPKMTSPCPHL